VAEVRRRYSYIPRDVTARFVAACATCDLKHSKHPWWNFKRESCYVPLPPLERPQPATPPRSPPVSSPDFAPSSSDISSSSGMSLFSSSVATQHPDATYQWPMSSPCRALPGDPHSSEFGEEWYLSGVPGLSRTWDSGTAYTDVTPHVVWSDGGHVRAEASHMDEVHPLQSSHRLHFTPLPPPPSSRHITLPDWYPCLLNIVSLVPGSVLLS
jgi:hypothetical protein